jgi:hypothetical protein
MANSVTTQVLEDGDKNVVVNVVGLLDTSDYAAATLLDPATLTTRIPPANRLAFVKAEFAVEDTLTVNLLWDATADVLFQTMMGRGELDWRSVGGIPNNAGAGVTGIVNLSTQGWSGGAILAFTLRLWFKKYNV